jgi:hypothetical protein
MGAGLTVGRSTLNRRERPSITPFAELDFGAGAVERRVGSIPPTFTVKSDKDVFLNHYRLELPLDLLCRFW